ncbi:hypothetical protein FHS59_002522 [Algoriphagus iocasae]|uniref:6-bladed beta-propeller protein n=1 Tax=Algoriphagus iocasae TaxID=1836499 RepID=A0A841MQA4_9BACT|nr:hypothetical protein [Algoriphagus iocasae]MBB6326894.1 hypothetical protein [Algoriphagus iocasae]
MKNRYFVFLVFFSIIACQAKVEKDEFPALLNLVMVDSVLIEESNFHLNSQFEVGMVADSLIAVSSVRTPAVGFYHISGKQRKRIASGDYPIGSFLPSNFDASHYPIVYLLDKKSESVLIFNVETQEFIKKIRLTIPEGKEARTADSKFKKLDNGFLIELASSEYDNYDPKYYNESGKLIYFFDEEGQVLENSFLEYPEELKNAEGSLKPSNYLVSSFYKKTALFSFPHEKKIYRYNFNELEKQPVEIPIPKSRFFDYSVSSAEGIISFDDIFTSGNSNNIVVPFNHTFTSIRENSESIIIETWMNNKKSGKEYATFSHLMVYYKQNESWYETSNPRNILDIGMLAGVVNDTLYFYEGSLMKHDEKYIKRAVLKPIKE